MGLDLDVSHEDGRCVLKAAGEVDLNTSPELRRAILAGIEKKEKVAVDLSGVEYMDSSGVATLVEGLKSSGGEGGNFVLLRPSESVMKVLQLARLNTLFDIRESL